MKKILHYRLPILSGILIATSFIPFYPWALLFCMLPLWSFWFNSSNNHENISLKKVFIAGWFCQFFITLVGFHWIIQTAHEFGHLPYPIAFIVLLLFSSFANLHIPLAGLAWGFLQKRYSFTLKTSLLLLVLLISLGEAFYPMIFPWHLGYPWMKGNWQGFQWADVIGTHGISTFTYLFNAGIYYIWAKRKVHNNLKTSTLSVALIAIFFSFNYSGSLHSKKWDFSEQYISNKNQSEDKPSNVKKINILNVQANIGNILKHFAEKGSAKAVRHISDKYMQLTKDSLKKSTKPIDLIIWPETAFTDYLDPIFQRAAASKHLFDFVKEIKTPLFTGAYSRDVEDPTPYNAIFTINTKGKIQQAPYRKSILLAFGEYFPGSETFPWLLNLVPEISNFAKGKGPKILNFPINESTKKLFSNLTLGPQICYEGLYPEFSRSLINQGAKILINITNDSWFASSFEPYQHLYMNSGRAIEFRRPLIRNTNTGISTVIQANGDFAELSLLNTSWGKEFTVFYSDDNKKTFFSLYGFWYKYLLLLIVLILTIRAEFEKSKKQ